MRPELELAAARYTLAVPRRAITGRIGERLGRGLGASVEFEDHRDYQPGDDPRHVDWRAYARTDRLAVRLYRDEVAPTLDVVVDRSAQLAVTSAKARAVRDLVGALRLWAGRGSAALRCFTAGGAPFAPEQHWDFDAAFAGYLPRARLRPHGLRVVISDFLRPDDPGRALSGLAAGAAHLYLLQVLDPWELEPQPAGPRTLRDAAGSAQADLTLDAGSIATYRQRLRRLIDDVGDAARRFGGSHAVVRAAAPEAMFGGDLARAGVVEPA